MEFLHLDCLLIILSATFCNVFSQSLADEESSNYVELKWYNINEETWNKKGAGSLMNSAIRDQVNQYCTASPMDCSLNSWSPVAFGTGNVRYLSGYPKEESPYWVFRLNVAFPASANASGAPTSYVVPRAALLKVLTDSRSQMNNYTGFHVVYIDTVHYSPPVRTTLNAVMIPVVIAIVLIIAFLLIGLHQWRKNVDAEEERKERLESKKRNTGFGANGNTGLVAESTPSLQRGRGARGHLSPYSQSSVGLSLDTPRTYRSHGGAAGSGARLPPLEETQAKKSRKHKKKRTHESTDSDDGQVNTAYQGGDYGQRVGGGVPPPSTYERNRDSLRRRQYSDGE